MTGRGTTDRWTGWVRALLVGTVALAAATTAQAAPSQARAAALAATITVSVCDQADLAAAVAQANADNAGDTIVFACSGDILMSGPLQLSGAMTIDGSGQSVTLDGQNSTQLVLINGGVSVTLNALTLAHGHGVQGGAINNNGTLALTNSVLVVNTAAVGSGLFNFIGATAALTGSSVMTNTGATEGGGLFNAGALTLSNSTLSGNSATYGGGLYDYSGATATLTGSTVSNNNSGTGGGLYNIGGATLTLANSAVSNNSSGTGGGLFNGGTLAITSSTLSGNSATYGGGIDNAGAGTLALSNSTIDHNSTGTGSNSSGGGIYNSATASLTNTTVSGNNTGSHGGGIDNTGALTLTAVTLSGNNAGNFGYGGGVYNAGTLTLSNSTLSGNSAGSNGFGGGIENDSGATAALANSTLSGNSSGYGGGLYDSSGAALTLSASIVSGNTGSLSGPDCYGTLASGDYNLLGTTSNCTLGGATGHDIVGQDPLLGPLQDNGGPTQTLLPGAGSPAINAIPTGSGLCPAADQRGLPRPDAGEASCDIGAVEVAEPPAALSFSPTSGQYGQPLTVSGQNFGPVEQVNVYDAHGALVYGAATQQDGSFSLNTTVAAAPFGPNTYTAIGQSSGNEATAVFTAQPLAQLSAPSASPGTPDAVSGYGFGASEPVTAYLGAIGGPALGGASSDGNGSYTLSFRVPHVAGGPYNVVSVGASSGAVYTDTLTVIPALHISPTHGTRGSKATISGAGYGAREKVRVYWDCTRLPCSGALTLGTRTTAASGVLSGLSVTIPVTGTNGLHTIGGVGLSSQTFATTTFRVTK